jgi:ATP-binding cassette, subfamily B, bacterial MsbA
VSAVGTQAAWPIYRRLLGFSARYSRYLGVAMIGMLVEAIVAGLFNRMLDPMVNWIFVDRLPDVHWWLGGAVVAMFALRGVATFVTDYGMARAGRSVVRDLREAVMWRYLQSRSERFDSTPVPALVSRLNYDTEQVAHASSDALKTIVTDTLIIVAMIVVMLSLSVRITLAMLVIAPMMGVIADRVGRRYRRINRGIQDGVAQMAASAEQALAAQQDVKIFGAQVQEAKRYTQLINRNLGLHMKVETTRAISSATIALLAATALAALIVMAGHEAMQDRMNAGQFVALMTAMMTMIPSLKRITNVQSVLQRGVAAADRLFETLDAEVEEDLGRLPMPRARGALEFDRVSVHYSGKETPALDDVSLRAAPGTVTAIVGRSGGGKSTLVRLLPRFYEPSRGEIRLDGVPLREIALADLRRQIALVSQKVMLFDDSIAANIAYGALEGAPLAQIREAARAANALEFIERLPQGFDTRIGENGALLSGGQRQRLAIARAFLKDAPILILDEATAALDSESERLVQDALQKLIPDRTTFVIAHRLSTVEHADQVLVLDQGRLVEAGRHHELLARDGLYAHLHRMQFREPGET